MEESKSKCVVKSVLVNICSTSSQAVGTMADGSQQRNAHDLSVMDSSSAEQTNRSNITSNDANSWRQNKSIETGEVTVAPFLTGNSILRSISCDYTDSTLFPTKSLTPSHGLQDENHRTNEGLPNTLSPRQWNEGTAVLSPDHGFPDLPSTRQGNTGTEAGGLDKGFPDLPSERQGTESTVAQGPDQAFLDLPSARRRNEGNTGTGAQGTEQTFRDLPPIRQGNAGLVTQGRDQAFPDLPSARRGNPGTVAQGFDQGFPDLPSARRGNAGTVTQGPDQAFPDLPSATQGKASTEAESPDQAFPDLPSVRRGNAGNVVQSPDQGFPDLPSPRQSNYIPIAISDVYYKEILWMILHDSGSNEENAERSEGNQSPTLDYNVPVSYDATVSVLTHIYHGERKLSNQKDTSRRIHEMFTKMLAKCISTETFVLETIHRKIKMNKSKLVKLTKALQNLKQRDLKRIHQLIKFSSLTLENIIEVVQLLLLMIELAAGAEVSFIKQLKNLSGRATHPDDSLRGTDLSPKLTPTELPTSQPENPLQPLLNKICTQEPVLSRISTLQPLLPGTSPLQPLVSESEDEENDHLSQQQFPGSFPVVHKEIQQLERSAGSTDSQLQRALSFYLIGATQGSAFELPQTGSNQTGDVDNVEESPHRKPAADHPQSASLDGSSYRNRLKSDAAGKREVSESTVDQRTHRIVDKSISLQFQILKTEQTYTLIRYEDSTLHGLIQNTVHGGTEDIKMDPDKRSSDSQ